MIRFLANIAMALYLGIFNLIYDSAWYLSLQWAKLWAKLRGRKVDPHHTDRWATRWGVMQIQGGFFLNRTALEINIVDERIKQHKGPFLMVINHQATYDIAAAFHVGRALNQHIRWVLKKELLNAPFVGSACRDTKCAFVDRKDREQAKAEFDNFTHHLKKDQVSAVIFVEGTRATPKKLERSDYQTLLNPRPFGLTYLHERLPDWPVLNVTLDWLGKRGKTMFGTSIWKAKLKIEVSLATAEEIGPDISKWLLEQEWPRREQLLLQWRAEFIQSTQHNTNQANALEHSPHDSL